MILIHYTFIKEKNEIIYMSKSFFRCAAQYFELCKSHAAGFQSNSLSSWRKGFTGITGKIELALYSLLSVLNVMLTWQLFLWLSGRV